MKFIIRHVLLISLFSILVVEQSMAMSAPDNKTSEKKTKQMDTVFSKKYKAVLKSSKDLSIHRSFLVFHSNPKYLPANLYDSNRTGITDITQSGSNTVLFYKRMICALLVWLLILGILMYKRHYRSAGKIKELKIEINELNACLETDKEKNDWLVKEIHHRVKNNLQIIMSLLNMQSAYLSNQDAIKAIRNCQHRMFAISLVHQKLYQTDNLSNVDMVAYTYELIEYLQDEYQNNSKKINFKVDMTPLALDVTMAVPFGLIINEALSNTLKFAFPAKSCGEVNISLHSDDLNTYNFQIADNGIGFDNDEKQILFGSLGNNLITGLANQLGGSCKLENDHGVKIQITFSKKHQTEAMAS